MPLFEWSRRLKNEIENETEDEDENDDDNDIEEEEKKICTVKSELRISKWTEIPSCSTSQIKDNFKNFSAVIDFSMYLLNKIWLHSLWTFFLVALPD